MGKIIRNSIRKTKENHSSIEKLKSHNHGHTSETPSNSPYNLSGPNHFEMINTLMVVIFCRKVNFTIIQMLMIQQQLQEMTQNRLTSRKNYDELIDRSMNIFEDSL